MSRKQLLVITERYWPEGSGGELATHLILEILRKEFNIVVLTGTQNPTKLPGVQYVYEPLLAKREKVWLWLNASRLASSQRFQKMLRKSDVVYIPRFSFPIIPIAKKFGKNVIVHLHDYIPISYTAVILAPYKEHRGRITRDDVMMECRKGLKYCVGVGAFWWLPRLARRWVSQADAVICVSNRQCEIIMGWMPEIKGKSVVIYNPLPNISPVGKELGEEKILLYLGGPSFVKGFHLVLKVANELLRKYRDLRILITKMKGYRSLPSNCVALGELPYRDVVRLHSRAYALLFPSIWEEPLPYVVIESMLMGTIPIAARTGGVPEVVAGSPAEEYLFTPGDVNEFMNKIEAVLTQSRDYILDVGMKSRDHVLKLFSNVENKIVNLFESVLTQKG
jgi:glycosyltransferase involved in cell wall biosynthesis